MKKWIIGLCVVLCLSFVAGFLTSHFTSNNSNANNNVCETQHNAQVQSLMQQIHNKQQRIYELWERADFYHRVLFSLLEMMDNQHILLEEAWGLMSTYRELLNEVKIEIRELERQIAELQRQLETDNPATIWTGIWGHWQKCCCHGGEYVFEKLFKIENDNVTMLIDFYNDECVTYAVHIIGNTAILVVDEGWDIKVGIVVVFCSFRDVFIVSSMLYIFDESQIDNLKYWFYEGVQYSQFLDTDYYFVMLTFHELTLIQRYGGVV